MIDLPAGLSPGLEARLPDLMRQAIAEARGADYPFGCLIVEAGSGQVLSRAGNAAGSDRTGHAEMIAIRALGSRGGSGTFLVTTAEPCPMCASACYWAGIPTIVFGTSIRTLIAAGWMQLDLPADRVLATATPATSMWIRGGVLSLETDLLYASGPPPRRGAP